MVELFFIEKFLLLAVSSKRTSKAYTQRYKIVILPITSRYLERFETPHSTLQGLIL
jgi:hypothetical protein